MGLTPEQEAAYSLDYGVNRADLKPQVQAEYDRLLAERRAGRQVPSKPGHVTMRPGPWQPPLRPVLRRAGWGVVMILAGLLLILIALVVFLGQGSQIRVRARVLSKRCHFQTDLATGQPQTLCNAEVRFTAVSGQVVTTTVGGALSSEFSGSGRSQTIDLRYDSDDPSQPFKQSNYMPVSTFILLLVFGTGALAFGCWATARAGWFADRAAAAHWADARRHLSYRSPDTSKPLPTSDSERPPPLPSDHI